MSEKKLLELTGKLYTTEVLSDQKMKNLEVWYDGYRELKSGGTEYIYYSIKRKGVKEPLSEERTKELRLECDGYGRVDSRVIEEDRWFYSYARERLN
jgi:hypothetical protein